ncbi:MAG TPA: methyltransferase, partial [Pirellulales bacterium]
MSAATASTLSLDFPADLRAIRDVLRFAGYTAEGLAGALGSAGLGPIVARNPSQVRYGADRAGILGTLMLVFLTPQEVELARFRDAVAPTDPETWAKVGLVRIANDHVHGAVELRPYQGLVLACDRSDDVGAGDALGVGSAAVRLDQLTIRSGVRSMLELGIGKGLQALAAAAAGCDHVLAVDGSARSVHFAKFNALLNRSGHVEFREGDPPAAGAGGAFDLIVGQPPFIVAPAGRPVAERDDPSGDAPLGKLIQKTAALLKEGGHAELWGTWLQIAGEAESLRFARWVADLNCDALVLRESRVDPAEFVARRLAGADLAADHEMYEREFADGISYFDRVRAESVHTGLIVLRKRSHGVNWTLFETLPTDRVGPCGESVLKLLQMQDFLRGFSDPRALLDVRLELAPDTYLAQKCEPAGGGWQIYESVLTRKTGLRYACEVHMPVAPIV